MEISLKQSIRIFWAVLVIFLLFSVLASLNGPTLQHDDLWYVTDIQTFIKTGRMTSNQVFPVLIFNNEYNPPLVTHNLPSMYFAIPFIYLTNPFGGWIIANILFSLFTCVILLRAASALGIPKMAVYLCGACFLAFPNTVYLSSHALSEAGTTFIVLLIAYMTIKHNTGIVNSLILGVLLAIATLNRASLLALSAIMIIYPLFNKEISPFNRIKKFIYVSASFILIMILGSYLFPQASFGGVVALLNTYGGMDHYYALIPLQFSLTELLNRIFTQLGSSFAGKSIYEQVFLLPFNMLIIWSMAVWPKKDDKRLVRMHKFVIALIVTHYLTIILVQFQNRYMQIIFPLMLLYFFATVFRMRLKKFSMIGILVFLLLSLFASGAYVKRNYNQAFSLHNTLNAYEPAADYLCGKGPILIISVNPVYHSWVFRDNKTLIARSNYTYDELILMRRAIPYEWIICHQDSPILNTLANLNPVLVDSVIIPRESFRLYKLGINP